MRAQLIQKVVDARAGQQRVILWLACGHKASILSMSEVLPMVGDEQACPFCPDPPPSVREKSAQELWRDAGEP